MPSSRSNPRRCARPIAGSASGIGIDCRSWSRKDAIPSAEKTVLTFCEMASILCHLDVGGLETNLDNGEACRSAA